MSNRSNRAMSDIVQELKVIMRLGKRLEESPQQRQLIRKGWVDHQIRTKVEELEYSTVTGRFVDGVQCLIWMLELHQDLEEKNFPVSAQEVSLAIVRQKSCFGSDTLNTQNLSQPTNASTGNIKMSFRLVALGTRNHKTSGADQNLGLIWLASTNAFHCFKGNHDLSAIYTGLKLVPNTVKLFLHTDKGNKVFIQSCVGFQPDARLFLQMKEKADIRKLFDFLGSVSKNDIGRQVLKNDILDLLVAKYK